MAPSLNGPDSPVPLTDFTLDMIHLGDCRLQRLLLISSQDQHVVVP